MSDRSKYFGLLWKWVGWMSCINYRGAVKTGITPNCRGPVKTGKIVRLLFSVKIVRGWRGITGCTADSGLSGIQWPISRLGNSYWLILRLGDSYWPILRLMCDDESYAAPLAEDIIISGFLQCIEPGMMATFTIEKTVLDVTAETGGECKLADVKNLQASAWGGKTVDGSGGPSTRKNS